MDKKLDISNDAELKLACEHVLDKYKNQDSYIKWIADLTAFFDRIQKADLDTRASEPFQHIIWENNPVSGLGMGVVKLGDALKDHDFRLWIAEQSLVPLPTNEIERLQFYQDFYAQIVEKLKRYTDRTPWMKIFRLFAAFYPQDFTTITYRVSARSFHKALFGKFNEPIKRQIEISRKFSDVLGPVTSKPEDLAKRITLPWLVFETYVQSDDKDDSIQKETSPGKFQLTPLPAVQRRKGLTSISGGLSTILNTLSFVGDGVTKDELLDHLRTEFPNYRENSRKTLFNVLKSEFYVIKQDGDNVIKTPRGDSLLETSDPEELLPILITRILGVDNILVYLKANGDKSSNDIYKLLQSVNPGWSTSFAPGAMLKWLKDFNLIEQRDNNLYGLTAGGEYWADQIHWEPEVLPKDDLPKIEVTKPVDISSEIDLKLVDINRLIADIQEEAKFDATVIKQLHFGLWSHKRRHFSIFTGLSGSGKTLLAVKYADALAKQYGAEPEALKFILPVQPGWYDPTPLFGYINPLASDTYVRPPLLDFILHANEFPNLPHLLILDEMNLSHPEQYLAPILSAMETGNLLRFHNEDSTFDGVPDSIPYPSNLVLIGTVNMDETTHGLSDKILDRAHVLEFWKIDINSYPNWKGQELTPQDIALIKAFLSEMVDTLSPVRLHFGWRTVADVLSFLDMYRSVDRTGDITPYLDDIIYAKVLPKLRGSESARLVEALKNTKVVLAKYRLSKSLEKITQLITDLSETGTMRFWR